MYIPIEILLEIISYIYPIIYGKWKVKMKDIEKYDFIKGRIIINTLSKICGNDKLKKICYNILFFKKNIKIEIIKKFNSKYIIAKNNLIIFNNLINLKYLNLYKNKNITDNEIKNLINIKYFNFYKNENISNNGIKNLINLKHINLHY